MCGDVILHTTTIYFIINKRMNKITARQHGYFIIPTDDGDRMLYEVFAKWELHTICWSSKEANETLEILWEKYKAINHLDDNQEENDRYI